jgi:hypothetical protein
MLSARALSVVASLIMPIALSSYALAATNPSAVHHKRARHQHPRNRAQTQAPPNQVEVINGSARMVQNLDAQQPQTAIPSETAPAATRVEVINGYSERTQVFNGDQSSAAGQSISLPRKKAKLIAPGKTPGSKPQVMNVEVINGARAEAKTFTGDPEQMSQAERYRRSHQRVVVGLESADSARRRRNSKPVVTRVTTSESESERAKSNPVVVAIASSESKDAGVDAPPTPSLPPQSWTPPRPPKRPPYHPASPAQ